MPFESGWTCEMSTYGPASAIFLVEMARADLLRAPSVAAPDLLPEKR